MTAIAVDQAMTDLSGEISELIARLNKLLALQEKELDSSKTAPEKSAGEARSVPEKSAGEETTSTGESNEALRGRGDSITSESPSKEELHGWIKKAIEREFTD